MFSYNSIEFEEFEPCFVTLWQSVIFEIVQLLFVWKQDNVVLAFLLTEVLHVISPLSIF